MLNSSLGFAAWLRQELLTKRKRDRQGDVMKTPLAQVMGALRLCNPSAFGKRLGNGPPSTREDCPVFIVI